ncbi:YbaB/EbfC family nucleoid-associated protein [Nocardia otitidiscaviarum]|uniref:YbaB/EbfC family nucleoid-associated protein n=1 Tax=Nocardia otitidiscaviarum TaxID=1823 RepID=UPI000AA969D1|nr:YbaB/EbfC family nucleoid-associated protein [Nocardia otitidiscaviarum]
MYGEGDAATLLVGFSEQMRAIGAAAQERARLTASATAGGGRVTVTVNADGAVIATRFADDVGELSYAEIAKAVTSAAQKAAAEAGRKTEELMRPLADRRARMPKLSELLEELPDLEDQRPAIPDASMAPPDARERLDRDAGAPTYADAEEYEEWRSRGNPGATDRSW